MTNDSDDPSGEAAAWKRLVDLYTPLVHHWCLRWGLQPTDAANIVPEVFRAAAERIRLFRRDHSGNSFLAWLRQITHSKVLDEVLRRPAGLTDEQLRELAKPPDSSPEQAAEERGLLCRGAAELIRSEYPERTWRAFWEFAVQDRPVAEVAAELGMTEAAVYSAKYRVTRRLRQEFNGLEDFGA